ncbi:cysteine proteinase [Rhizopus microsporus var. microsporus]|uniref:Cysteine proteinase n=1 Tax=Rhizopus microsporus var. microsporus TaxID=86635 RepID=A0A1X0R9P3_RHIZD|nr:cysteine proteinase [Rhizopus microsporus var. microsporus]
MPIRLHCLVDDIDFDRQKLIQKLNEYKHRIEQLERYLDGIKPTRKNTSIYINENSPYQSRRDLFETEIERSIQDEWIEKAKFSFDQAELNEEKGNTEHALDYYSDAAELYLKAFKEYPNDTEEKLYARQEFMKAIDKAEQLKAQQQKATQFLSPRTRSSSSVSSTMDQLSNGSRRRSSSTSIQQQPTDDVMTQKLSASEIEVLKHTSSVNNNTFLPWIDETDLKEQFSYPTKFLDPMGSLALSEKQQEKFGGWRRPCDIMRHPKLICCISSTSIIQDIVTDCSFVASLCVAAAYEQKFKKQLITSCIYPQNKQGLPCYNPNGKYVVKLVYNGIARKVVVDDLLPVSREGTLMCTFSTTKGELWASIIEKAYMKLMGGYDFPGSNSGIDLHCLTGWIPEHIFIHDKYFVPDNVWDRILDGMKYGDVLVTIATGEMTEEEAARLGLVPTHAYAVIDITVIHGKRLLQVKNPWSHKRWRGPYSHLDSNIWTAELREALSFDPDAAEENDDGIFWIDYESVCTHFTSIHLNWNPELFTHRWVLHSVWPEHVGPKKDVYSLAYNPQFSLKVNVPDKKPAAVWLLLSKHIMVTEENTDYITLHVYSNTGGERIYYPDNPFKEGTYVNSPHILVRFNAPPGESDYTIVVSQHEKERSLYFSIRAYSLAPFKLHEVPIKYSVEKKIHGQWTEQTAGGSASNVTYLNNPQWKLTIPPTPNAELLLMLEAPKGFAIHLLLVEGGKRASSVSVRDILAESGPYRHGFCYCQLDHIRSGDYTIVASTFEPDLLGKFILTVASTTQLYVEPIPLEGAGMFKKVIHGEWIVGYNAMGCPSFGNYSKNPRYLLEVRELTTVKVRLQSINSESVPSMNVTIYEKHPTELFGKEVATSGPYTNVTQGVATNEVVLSQSETGYIIVLATHDKDVAGEFTAIVYSDRPVNVTKDR